MTLDVLRTAFHRLYLVYLVPGARKSQAKEENTKVEDGPQAERDPS